MYIRKGYTAPWRVRMMRKIKTAVYNVLDLLRVPKFDLERAFSMSAVAGTVSSLNSGGPAIQAEQKFLHVIGTAVLTGNYPGAPGDTWDLTQLILPPGWTLPALGTLIIGWAASIKAAGPSGFSYTVIPGATLQTTKLDVQQGGGAASPNGEIPTAAYPAAVLGDTVQFELLFGIAA
jgi:hypothetical protein